MGLKKWLASYKHPGAWFHTLYGILTVLSVKVNPILPLIYLATFVLYERNEEKWLKDAMYQEIREYSVGVALGTLFML